MADDVSRKPVTLERYRSQPMPPVPQPIQPKWRLVSVRLTAPSRHLAILPYVHLEEAKPRWIKLTLDGLRSLPNRRQKF